LVGDLARRLALQSSDLLAVPAEMAFSWLLGTALDILMLRYTCCSRPIRRLAGSPARCVASLWVVIVLAVPIKVALNWLPDVVLDILFEMLFCQCRSI
jgi:hypothetical protein